MQQYVIVYLIGDLRESLRFTAWPLHMTLLPWFYAPSVDQVKMQCQSAIESIEPFRVSIGERAYFGEKKLPVKLIDNSIQLQKLHDCLLKMVEENSWRLMGRYTGPNFRPHVTQKGNRDAEGALFVDKIHIVEAQEQGYRQIVATINL